MAFFIETNVSPALREINDLKWKADLQNRSRKYLENKTSLGHLIDLFALNLRPLS